jgi:hypothetical protein
LPEGSRTGVRVREAPHAAHGAEVVVEGAVLLHQEDDVLDVLDGARPVVGRDGECLVEVLWQGGGHGRNAQQRQERATVDIAHSDAPYPNCCPRAGVAER